MFKEEHFSILHLGITFSVNPGLVLRFHAENGCVL